MKSLNGKLWTELTIEEVEERIERMLMPLCITFEAMMCGCFGFFRTGVEIIPNC